MEFTEITLQEFEKLKFSCGNFLQSAEMAKRYQNLGKEFYLLGVKEKGKIIAAGLFLAKNWHFGQKIFRVPGGFLLDYDSEDAPEVLEFLTRKTREFLRKKKGMVLMISPNIIAQPRDIDNNIVEGKGHLEIHEGLVKMRYKYLGEYEQVKWIFMLDLKGKTAEEVWNGLRGTHRQRLRRAERDGIKVRELSEDELSLVKQIVGETGVRRGFSDPSLDYYRSMKEAFGKKVKLMVAERMEGGKRQALAVAMFVISNDEMVYLYSGTNQAGHKYAGSHQMQWQMIQEAIKMGMTRYNFYGTKPIKGNGVYEFKQGFRGTMEELLGTFALPLNGVGKVYLKRIRPCEMKHVQ